MSDREYLQTTYQGEPIMKFPPRILDVNGGKVWVDNVVQLGDVIEQTAGREICELYFEITSQLIDEVSWRRDEAREEAEGSLYDE